MKILRVLVSTLFILTFLLSPAGVNSSAVLAQATGCASSAPPSTKYNATICFSSPQGGSTLTGDSYITATIAVAGTSPGIQRLIFYINGEYLLTDFQSPYTFFIPTQKWVDGNYTLAVEAYMRDTYVTQRAVINVSFNNGITSPPVNTNQFQPSIGTTPANGAPFVVAAGGDGASGENNAISVTNLLTSLNPNLFLYLGDVYNKGTITEFYNWYGKQGVNFGSVRSITNPVVGNHEYENHAAPGYFDYWDNIPDYYSYNAGGWHFIALNSNVAEISVGTNSAQYQWLQQDLAAHANECTIAYYHHPLFNIGPAGTTSSLSDMWKLMAQYGVEIVLNGHDHTYQRWVPLNGNGQPSATGITEFVAGASGHGVQTIASSDNRVAYSNDSNPTAFGILLFELNPSGAAFKYKSINGSILDSGVIPCNNAATDTQPPSVPTGLSAAIETATRVNLSWSASSDNVGVSGYTVYRNGSAIGTVDGHVFTFVDQTTLPSTNYQYTVDAFDNAGNHSAKSTAVSITTPVMPSSLTFPVEADTYVSAGSTSSNYGAATTFRLDASPDLHAYLRFNVLGLAGYQITKASLKVYANNNSSVGIYAQTTTNNWDELTVNYNNAPALGSVIGSSGSLTAGSWASVDVTPYITGEGTVSIGVNTSSSSALSFATRESGVNAAQLVLDIQSGPLDSQPPSVPGGVSATASDPNQVNLSWTASTDNVGVTGYTIYRNGSSLTTVAGNVLSYNDSTVQPNTTYQYTLDAFDQIGNHSAPSSPASVTTPVSSTVTLTPVADTYVNGSSPTSNYGSGTTLREDASPDLHAYLRFNVQGLSGLPITQARLLVYSNSNSSLGVKVQSVADNSWGETTTIYTNAPALGSVLASSGALTSGSWASMDVTGYVTGEGTVSFGVSTTSSSSISLASRETGANAPRLVLDLNTSGPDGQAPSAPGGLSAVAANANQVDLNWSASTDNVGVAGYTLFRDGGSLTTVAGNVLSYSDTSVQPDITYQYTLDAFDQAGNHSGLSSAASVTTPNLPASLNFTPEADTYVNGSSPTSNYGSGTTLRADASPDLHGYIRFNVQGLAGKTINQARLRIYSNSNSSTGIRILSVAGNNWEETTTNYTNAPALGGVLGSSGALSAGSWYQLDVTSYVTGEGAFSFGVDTLSSSSISLASRESGANAPQLVVTLNNSGPDGQAPSIPAGLSATAASAAQVNLNWSASLDNVGVTGYTIYRDGNPLATVSNVDLSYNDTTTQPVTAYQYTVDAFDQAGNHSAASAPASVTTPDVPPSVPANLNANVVGVSQIDLTWSASTDNIGVDGYTIYRDGNPLATVSGANLSYSDTTVSAATSYVYTVDAYDQPGNHSAPSNPISVSTPDNVPPSTPDGLSATAASPTQVSLSWNAATDNVGVTGYTIYRDGNPLTTVAGSASSFNDTSASPASTYQYTIDAFDQAGNHSAQSAPASVTTPNLPASLTFTPEADTYVNGGSVGSNYGSATAIRVDASPDVHSYIRFNVQGTGGKSIAHANLRLYATSNSSQGISVLTVADNGWSENAVNYNNAPALGSSLASIGNFTTGSWITLDVSAYITGEGTFSFGITTPSSTAASMASRESGSNAPQLIIDLQ